MQRKPGSHLPVFSALEPRAARRRIRGSRRVCPRRRSHGAPQPVLGDARMLFVGIVSRSRISFREHHQEPSKPGHDPRIHSPMLAQMEGSRTTRFCRVRTLSGPHRASDVVFAGNGDSENTFRWAGESVRGPGKSDGVSRRHAASRPGAPGPTICRAAAPDGLACPSRTSS